MLWLQKLGAEVQGYSLAPENKLNLHDLLNQSNKGMYADIRNRNDLKAAVKDFEPDIVFHLAAQPLVRRSYADPVTTYETNVIGTLNILEQVKNTPAVKACVCITTDKVYQNQESTAGYTESDKLGGYDPYSSSKACTEILVSSYRNSFLNIAEYDKSHNCLIASARAGNVVGGGDWSEDRLIPDIIRSIYEEVKLDIRSPKSVRPWQHVLDCLHGYLLLGGQLLHGKSSFAKAWNFGPADDSILSVEEILNCASTYFDELKVSMCEQIHPHETGYLKLNSNLARTELNWNPEYNGIETFHETFSWYESYYDSGIKSLSEDAIDKFMKQIS